MRTSQKTANWATQQGRCHPARRSSYLVAHLTNQALQRQGRSAVTKSDASDTSTKMAEAHSRRTENPSDAHRMYGRVDQAAFSALLDLIPDDAIATVVDRDDESPRFVALSGERLYVLTVGNLENDLEAATTNCAMRPVDPSRSSVDCEVRYIGVRTGPEPADRETTWRFDLGGEQIVLETLSRPRVEGHESADEIFAQALAAALGWEFSPPDLSRPPITVLEEAS